MMMILEELFPKSESTDNLELLMLWCSLYFHQLMSPTPRLLEFVSFFILAVAAFCVAYLVPAFALIIYAPMRFE